MLRGTWDFPGPGLELVSPALAGKFLTTVPAGKPQAGFSFKLSGLGQLLAPSPPHPTLPTLSPTAHTPRPLLEGCLHTCSAYLTASTRLLRAMRSQAIGQMSLITKSRPAKVNRWAPVGRPWPPVPPEVQRGQRTCQGPTARAGGHQTGTVDTWNP